MKVKKLFFINTGLAKKFKGVNSEIWVDFSIFYKTACHFPSTFPFSSYETDAQTFPFHNLKFLRGLTRPFKYFVFSIRGFIDTLEARKGGSKLLKNVITGV